MPLAVGREPIRAIPPVRRCTRRSASCREFGCAACLQKSLRRPLVAWTDAQLPNERERQGLDSSWSPSCSSLQETEVQDDSLDYRRTLRSSFPPRCRSIRHRQRTPLTRYCSGHDTSTGTITSRRRRRRRDRRQRLRYPPRWASNSSSNSRHVDSYNSIWTRSASSEVRLRRVCKVRWKRTRYSGSKRLEQRRRHPPRREQRRLWLRRQDRQQRGDRARLERWRGDSGGKQARYKADRARAVLRATRRYSLAYATRGAADRLVVVGGRGREAGRREAAARGNNAGGGTGTQATRRHETIKRLRP